MDTITSKLNLMLKEEYNMMKDKFEDYPVIKSINTTYITMMKPLLKNKNIITLSLYVSWKQLYDMNLSDDSIDIYTISYNWHNNTYDSIEAVIDSMKEDYETNKKIF